MKRKLILIIPVIINLIAISCKDNGVSSSSGIKTPREMTWTSITLTSPDSTSSQLLPENLVAFSPTDMWLVCWCDVARGLLWHYNADGWKESNIFGDVGGMRVNDVAGRSSYDLWAAGYSGKNIFLGHYNGSKWTREDNMGIDGEILDMCKDDEGNIWACGRNGVILKYSDNKWVADTIKIAFQSSTEYFLKSVEYYNDKIFVLASTQNTSTLIEKYYYLYGDIKNWTLADSIVLDSPSAVIKWGYRGLYSINFGNLYSYGLSGIWIYEGKTWSKELDVDGSINGIYGNNKNYLIGAGDFQNIFFSDGNNWNDIKDLFSITDVTFVFKNAWTNGYETIIVGYGTVDGLQKTIIWRGK
jgi:hypothetical protein